MKILITGGAGFVGSVLIPVLIEAGHRVTVYDNFTFGADGLFCSFVHPTSARLTVIHGDVRDAAKLKKACMGQDMVIHLAALVGYPICKKYQSDATTINVGGTHNLANISKELPIIFASTGSCYGNVEEICSEDSLLQPLTVYGETKKLAEEVLRLRGNFVIYRFATGYGVSPRMRLDLLVNDFCYKAVKDKYIVIYERHFKRTFINVADMARAFRFVVSNYEHMKNKIYNVGSNNLNFSKQQIAEFIKNYTEYEPYYADVGKDEDKRDYIVSYDKIEQAGFVSNVSFESGVKALVDLFRVFELKPQYSNI